MFRKVIAIDQERDDVTGVAKKKKIVGSSKDAEEMQSLVPESNQCMEFFTISSSLLHSLISFHRISQVLSTLALIHC